MISFKARKPLALFLIVFFVLASQKFASVPKADTRPTEDRGAMALGQAIKRLAIVGSVLHTGAHPDDEDSGLLAYLARGRQVRTAYLSLTRGDGGQNVIGPELYEPLGVIRTDELLAARRLDGARQFFTRAFDFGFSKSRTETLAKWDRKAVLGDIVRVIRTFRPLVIVSAWSGTPNDGHGHHQSSGLLTQEAYRAAADPSQFPEQLAEGLRPWQAKKLYLRSFDGAASPREFLPSMATLSLNTGEFDPLLGCSYYEIAARGRSQHRSQDEGTLEARGPRYSKLRLIDSKLGSIRNEKDIFDDIDTSIVGIAGYAGSSADRLRPDLTKIQATANEAAAKFNPFRPGAVCTIIANGLSLIRDLRSRINGNAAGAAESGSSASIKLSEAEQTDLDFLLRNKESDFQDALLKSEGVVVDCLSDDEIVTPGQAFTVTLSAYADSSAKFGSFGLHIPTGWTSVPKGKEKITEVEGRQVLQTEFTVTVGSDAEPTRPYWLKAPRTGDMFTIEKPTKGATGIEAVAPSAITGFVNVEIGGAAAVAEQGIEYRYADRAFGEIRRELKVAPIVSVNVSPDILIYPRSSSAVERQINVSITNNRKGGVRGTVALKNPEGWRATPASSTFDLKREGERAVFSFTLADPAGIADTEKDVVAVATVEGISFTEGYQVVSYPHIGSRFVYHPATAHAEVIDVKVASGLKVGFIEGAGDDFAAALERIGVNVKTVDSKELASGNLNAYDTIVAGVRTYEVRPDVIANNARLMEFVNQGGTYIVQYSRGNFETGGFAPYRIGREDARAEQAGRQREPRLFYIAEAEIAQALVPKGTAKPRVGFIGAANDKLLASLQKTGLDTRVLSGADLGGELSQLDIIVVGADSGKRPELSQYNSRLLEFSRGKLVVLAYSPEQFINGDFPVFPKPEARPFRVTDETAKVTILEPNHPRFNVPNKITERDFDGWVQERGAYFLSDWDSHFKPLMACHDPGEPDLKGGEVIAEYGKGLYVYSAYAWFRELPKGVPGAYRLIANLVSLPKTKK